VKVAVITISDRAARGEYQDLSGPEIVKEIMAAFPDADVSRRVVPDEPADIQAALEAEAGSDFILTTGGTGISPRDVTPEVTARFCQREIPGIAEMLRSLSYGETPAAVLSRGYAGQRGATIVVNFPGSVKAVQLCTRALGPVMTHAMRMLRGEGHERRASPASTATEQRRHRGQYP
jgi:molybdenum cofactor synthesis domain-containing protein